MNSCFIILFILIELSFGQNQVYFCNKTQECDNCIMCNEVNKDYCSCNFDNGFCIIENGLYIVNEFLYNFDGCIKNNGNLINICGNSDIELEGGETTIHIPSEINSNTLCYYNFKYIGNDNNKNMSISLRRARTDYPKFSIYLLNNTNNEMISFKYNTINSNNYELINLKAKKLSLYVDIVELNYTDGLFIKFAIKSKAPKEGFNIAIIIVIVVIAAFLVGIIIACCCLIKRKKDDNKSYVEAEKKKKLDKIIKNEKNKAELDKLFQNEMTNALYNKINDINNCNKCLFCNNNFIDNSSIIIKTKCCNHIFDESCFKNYAYTNVDNPKCPKCKEPLIKPDKENDSQNKSTDNANETNNNMQFNDL